MKDDIKRAIPSEKNLDIEIKILDEESRVLQFIASTSAIDRAGDVIDQMGWKLERYKQNPVFLDSHNSYMGGRSILGKCTRCAVENGKLVMDIEFWKSPEDSDMQSEHDKYANMVYQMYKLGFMKAVSVGFITIDYKFIEREDDSYGYDIKEAELLELSAVAIPCNQEALMVERGIDVSFVKSFEAKKVEDARLLIKEYECKHNKDNETPQNEPLDEENTSDSEESIENNDAETTEEKSINDQILEKLSSLEEKVEKLSVKALSDTEETEESNEVDKVDDSEEDSEEDEINIELETDDDIEINLED